MSRDNYMEKGFLSRRWRDRNDVEVYSKGRTFRRSRSDLGETIRKELEEDLEES